MSPIRNGDVVGVGDSVGVGVDVAVGLALVLDSTILSKFVSQPLVDPSVTVEHGVVKPVCIVARVFVATLWVFVVLPAQLIDTVVAVFPPL